MQDARELQGAAFRGIGPLVAHDDGPGVPDELREQVFFPLVTGRSDGTGLGLSIAQSLAHQHGGLIEYASIPGDTTFSLILPVENGP